MFARSIRPVAVRLSGVRYYYGKRFPDQTLKLVQVFHRHGDRTPLHNYYEGSPKAKEEDEMWKQYIPSKEDIQSIYSVYKYEDTKPDVACDPIYGQLTHEGIVQMQHVGKRLRHYYMEEEQLLTDKSFNTTEVSLRSTCRDRTIHSIQSMISTLFPVKEYNSSYPIIKVASDENCVLNRFDAQCKDSCYKRLQTYDWQCYVEKMDELYKPTVTKELPFFAHQKEIKWTDVMDFVVTRYSHLMDIPEDLYNIFPKVYMHNVNKYLLLYNTPKCLHSFTDGLFGMIKKEADARMAEQIATKMSIYSCHDTSIIPMLSVLTPYLPADIPKYSANICLEYWQNNFDKSYNVAMRYNGEYQPIFIEHYQEALIVPYTEFCKTLTIPKYLLEVMRDKNKVLLEEEQ